MLSLADIPTTLFLLLVSSLNAPGALARLSSTEPSGSSSQHIASAWYAGYHSADVPHAFPLSDVNWGKYTHMAYAVAVTSDSPPYVVLETEDEQLLPQFVEATHQHNVTAILTIGGWTGSQYFSSLVGSADNRTTFVKTLTNLTQSYALDGVELDWEYPGTQGIGCNVVSPNDTSNLLLFLQQLRQDETGKNLVVTMPVFLTPFVDASGQPSTNVSAFGEVLDYISIMNYDVSTYLTDLGRGPSGVGPNSPLNSSCSPPNHVVQGSAASAVDAWSEAGFPKSQIVLGVPSYGHSFFVERAAALVSSSASSSGSASGSASDSASSSTLVGGGPSTTSSSASSSTTTTGETLAQFPPYNASLQPSGDAWDGGAGTDICGNPTPVGGVWDFWGLVDGGFLDTNGDANTGAGDVVYRFDDCSQTPYVYNTTSEVMVSYDNAQSFAAKGTFISSQGLAGFAMWEAGGDYNNILLDSITAAIQSTPAPPPSPSSGGGGGGGKAGPVKASSGAGRLGGGSVAAMAIFVWTGVLAMGL